MTSPRTPSHFVWHDCLTPDVDLTLKYFTDLVQWGVFDQTWPNVGRYPIALVENNPVAGVLELPKFLQESGVPSYWTGYVETDVRVAESLIPEKGGHLFTMPTTSAMGVSFVFTDPGGAVLAAYELSDSFAIPSMQNRSEFVWRRLYVQNDEQSQLFYSALFGWKFQSANDVIRVLDSSEGAIADLLPMPNWIESDVWVYFIGVDDLSSTINRAKIREAAVLEETSIDSKAAVVTKDPFGAIVGFVQL